MSLYVMDTDILTLYREGHPTVCQRVVSCPPEELAITVISVEEQLTGWYSLLRRAKPPHELAHVYERLAETVLELARLRILHFSESAIARFEQLVSLKLRIGTMDLRIAAITIEAGGILVTRNVRDFQRIPNLAVEDWSV